MERSARARRPLRRRPWETQMRASSAGTCTTTALDSPAAGCGSHMCRGPTLNRPLEALEDSEDGAEERGVITTAAPQPPPWLKDDPKDSRNALGAAWSPKLEGARMLRMLCALSGPLLRRLTGPLLR